MQYCLLFTRILEISCKAPLKLFCKILVQKYYVVGIKTVVVAIKCIKRRVFFLGAVRKIVSTTFIYVRIVKITHGFHSYSLLVVF